MNKSQISLLIAIKTADTLQKEKIQVYLQKINIPILVTLYKHGIIQNFTVINSGLKKQIFKVLIFLFYTLNLLKYLLT